MSASDQDPGRGRRTMAAPVGLLATRMHITLRHGVWTGDVHTIEELDECHTACHNGQLGDPITHDHHHLPPAPHEAWEW